MFDSLVSLFTKRNLCRRGCALFCSKIITNKSFALHRNRLLFKKKCQSVAACFLLCVNNSADSLSGSPIFSLVGLSVPQNRFFNQDRSPESKKAHQSKSSFKLPFDRFNENGAFYERRLFTDRRKRNSTKAIEPCEIQVQFEQCEIDSVQRSNRISVQKWVARL